MLLDESTSANGNSGQSSGVSLKTLLQAMEKKLDNTVSRINQSVDERLRSGMAEVHQRMDKELLNVQSRQESGAQRCPPETGLTSVCHPRMIGPGRTESRAELAWNDSPAHGRTR